MSLGGEVLPAVTIGRPRFRDYPGPPTAAILFLPFAALAAFGFLTFRAQLSPGFYWFMAIGAAFLLLGALITFAIWLRFGVTLSLRELGVVIDTRAIPYASIDALTIRDKRRYDETATVRVLTRTIAIEAAGRKVKAVFVARPAEALDEVLDALAARIAAVPRPRAGKGWRIDQNTLHVRETRTPLSTITAAGIFDGEVRLWRDRDERPFLSVPVDSKNARVLVAALPPTANRQPPTTPGLGRLLFSRRTTIASVVGNTILAAFVIALAWFCVARFLPQFRGVGDGIAIGAAVLWFLHATYRATVRYHFHEHAVVRRSLLGTRTVAYANVAAMEWRETVTVLEHAIPMGTTVRAKLVPNDGTAPLDITLHRFRGTDGDLEPLREAIERRSKNV